MTNKKGFRGVSIKKELVDNVEHFIEAHPEAGYKSVSDLVQEAVRMRIQEVKKIYLSPSEETVQ